MSELVRGFLLGRGPGPRSGLGLTLASARSRGFGWVLRPELCSWAVIRIGRWAANSAQGVRIPAFVGCGLASLVSHMEDATSQL